MSIINTNLNAKIEARDDICAALLLMRPIPAGVLGHKRICIVFFLGPLALFATACTTEARHGRKGSPVVSIAAREVLSLSTWATWEADCEISEDGRPALVVHKRTGIEMVYVPPATFRMGSGDEDVALIRAIHYDRRRNRHYDSWFEPKLAVERPDHTVALTRGFYLGKYEVTNKEFYTWNQMHEKSRGVWLMGVLVAMDAPRQPACCVSWEAANRYCHANDLRLPTEAEWEYAARAGSLEIYPWGNRPEDGSRFCNYGDATWCDPGGEKVGREWPYIDGYAVTAPVGSFQPNRLGLYDMMGNIAEWCSDWFDEEYYRSNSRAVDPLGPANGEGRVLRGGAFNWIISVCRSSARFSEAPNYNDFDCGFRVARSP